MELRITLIALHKILGEHKDILDLFVTLLMISSNEIRKWALYSGTEQIEQKVS